MPILVGCDGILPHGFLSSFFFTQALVSYLYVGIVLPFESSDVRYNDFVTRVPRMGLGGIRQVVNSLAASSERVQRMRSAMESAWMRITWQRTLLQRGTNRGLDAFELLLREIAKRKR